MASFFGLSVPILFIYFATAIFALIAGYFVRNEFDGILSVAILCVFMIPLHTYDITVAVFLFSSLITHSKKVVGSLAFAGVALLFRAGNLGAASGLADTNSMEAFTGSLIASLGLLLGLLALL